MMISLLNLASVPAENPLPAWATPVISLALIALVLFVILRGENHRKTNYQKRQQEKENKKSEGLNWDNDDGINGN